MLRDKKLLESASLPALGGGRRRRRPEDHAEPQTAVIDDTPCLPRAAVVPAPAQPPRLQPGDGAAAPRGVVVTCPVPLRVDEIRQPLPVALSLYPGRPRHGGMKDIDWAWGLRMAWLRDMSPQAVPRVGSDGPLDSGAVLEVGKELERQAGPLVRVFHAYAAGDGSLRLTRALATAVDLGLVAEDEVPSAAEDDAVRAFLRRTGRPGPAAATVAKAALVDVWGGEGPVSLGRWLWALVHAADVRHLQRKRAPVPTLALAVRRLLEEIIGRAPAFVVSEKMDEVVDMPHDAFRVSGTSAVAFLDAAGVVDAELGLAEVTVLAALAAAPDGIWTRAKFTYLMCQCAARKPLPTAEDLAKTGTKSAAECLRALDSLGRLRSWQRQRRGSLPLPVAMSTLVQLISDRL